MNVFLDTNTFYNNWFVSNVNFKLLFYYLNNEKHYLLLSELVAQEVNNIRERELEDAILEIERLIKKCGKLNLYDVLFSKDDLGIKAYDVRTILHKHVHWIENVEYENIQHAQVVNRALKLIKPFSGQEKGYRDTLIWLSFLNYLENRNKVEDVAFITNNKNDFFVKKNGKLTFNNHLQKDIDELNLKANITPYTSIYDFITDNVDKIKHSFNREEILDEQESFLISETENYLNSMNNDDLSELLNSRVFREKLTSVIEIESEVLEGLEDPIVNTVKSLPETSVFIDCYYEMRRVDLIITIDTIEYKQHADEIERLSSLYNIELDDDYVKLSFLLRTCIEGSFEYETKNGIASNLSINNIFNQ